jgi:hypothetical protein
LHDGRDFGVISHTTVVQRDLRPGIRERRIRVRRDQQKRMLAEPAGTHPGDLRQELIALEAERADDPRGQRIGR